jgi:N-acylneuraminate cytidylyltransferase
LAQRGLDAGKVVYVGNDTNDLPCFEAAGWAVAVADSLPEVLRAADYVLSKAGGHGAVRELCDLILSRKEVRP